MGISIADTTVSLITYLQECSLNALCLSANSHTTLRTMQKEMTQVNAHALQCMHLRVHPQKQGTTFTNMM